MTTTSLDEWVDRALAGDRDAIETLLVGVKDDVYGLAIRMLLLPQDAEDATQEALMRVAAGLPTFEGRSQFRTWVYRIAVRTLLNFRRGAAEPPQLSFEAFGADLLNGLQNGASDELVGDELTLLTAEVKIACTQAMLMCLDRNHRMAYLLGVVFELDGEQAAACLDVQPATYRKRLSRSRERVEAFTRAYCGLADAAAPCRCAGRIGPARQSGRVDPLQLLFAEHPVVGASEANASALADVLTAECRGDALMRTNPRYLAPERLLARLRQVDRSAL